MVNLGFIFIFCVSCVRNMLGQVITHIVSYIKCEFETKEKWIVGLKSNNSLKLQTLWNHSHGNITKLTRRCTMQTGKLLIIWSPKDSLLACYEEQNHSNRRNLFHWQDRFLNHRSFSIHIRRKLLDNFTEAKKPKENSNLVSQVPGTTLQKKLRKAFTIMC